MYRYYIFVAYMTDGTCWWEQVLEPQGKKAEGVHRMRASLEQLVGPRSSLGRLPMLGADFV